MADLLRAFEEELQSKNFKGYRYSSGQKKRWFKFPIQISFLIIPNILK